MKEKTIVGIIVGLLALAIAIGTKSTDLVFVAVAVGFFALCIAYVEWCGRL
jgi:hypothetical protein